ncbi:MAG TPA: RsmB/NOP family class I SAM-dependent RNA methyltransferase, partial [Burkholderiaceae bacterium]|nr:RsmB/NOP family class I SAM-dependent RNA methyltransferase [Burkholderiaceae bacterium]
MAADEAPAAEPASRASGAAASVAVSVALQRQVERALAAVLRLDGPADAALRRFFQSNPRLGRRDRGVIAETVFDVLRHRRRYAHLAESLTGSHAARLLQLSIGRRSGSGAAVGLDAGERETLARALAVDVRALPQPVRLSLPDWLHRELLADLGNEAELEALGTALLEPAPLDLRANLLKTDPGSLQRALALAGVIAEPIEPAGTALRVQGKPALETLPQFQAGWFEVQDAGSQKLVEFCAPRRGSTVVDFCAGAGGKTLALAAAMRSSGQIYACDVSAARLSRLRPRLARSGATNVHPIAISDENDPKLARLQARADLVLVDAPCSGVGTLRRHPELKWRLSPAAVAELGAKQRSILRAAA